MTHAVSGLRTRLPAPFLALGLALALALAVLAGGCAKPAPVEPIAPTVRQPGEVEDLRVLPQDLAAYLPNNPDRPVYSKEQAQLRLETFLMELYKPWTLTRPEYPKKTVAQLFARYEKSPGFKAKGQPHDPQSAARLEQAADLRAYPNARRKAMTVRHANLRGLPTSEPRFLDPTQPGEGYPFDYLQHSSLPIGTPILVTHATRDGSWVLAEAALTFGWLPARDVAYVDDVLADRLRMSPYAAIVREKTVLPGPGSPVAHIGAVLPAGSAPGTVLYPAADPNGMARLIESRPPAGSVAPMPLAPTPKNVAALGNAMMRQPYGWGGLDENRDCSALTRDLYAPFAIWLPRNSSAQSMAGAMIPLGDMPPSQKEQVILSESTPFFSLVYMKGHVMVHVGQYKGRPVIFHNIWGLRTLDPATGRDGRLVLGRAVVTTLRAGEEVPSVGPDRLLVNRVQALTILAR